MAKMPVLFLPRAGKQGREAGARRSSRARGLGARRQPGVGEKGPGRRTGLIPGRGSARGGLGWLGHGGRRRRLVAALDR